MFDRQFPDIEDFHRNHATLLSILCVAQGPLPEPILLSALDIPAPELEARLKPLRVFLEVRSSVGSKTYTLFHRTIAEWLMDRQASEHTGAIPAKATMHSSQPCAH